MKTNHAARQIVRIRMALCLVAVLGIIGVEIGLGGSFASRFNQTTATRTTTQQPAGNWNVSFSIPDLGMMAR